VSDDIDDALNYRTLTKRVIEVVEGSRFFLVERLAAEVAALCLQDPRVECVRVSVEKPGALRFARSVGVQIERSRADLARGPVRVLVSVGSNIDPERNLSAAVERLRERCRVTAVSTVYETEPVGGREQPRFLNAAVLLETDLTPAQLRAQVLRPIEQDLGRVRTSDKYGPRTIDLDISLYGDRVLELGGRRIPDPDILRYAHIAVPLADVAPEQRHPETGQTLADIARQLPHAGLQPRPDLAGKPA
jgi:2-amino-4-hydroxy-6-hydroxymethyldihydropteridine diphosphokinase